MPAEKILEKLMSEHGDAILRVCYLYLKDYHLAQDATQETFIKAMKSYDSFEHKSSEKTWLTRIAINCCKNIMRTRWFHSVSVGLGEEVNSVNLNPIEELLEKGDLSNAIMSLNKSEREIIILYYYQELSIKEISAIVGKKENALNQQLRRAREKLKKILKEDGYGIGEYQRSN